MEPSVGELDYNLARKNPRKFFDKLCHEPITQHRVTDQGKRLSRVQSEVKPRRFTVMMKTIETKLQKMLTQKLNGPNQEALQSALQHPQV